MLDPATSEIASGSKLGIDAMKKIPGEGFKPPWPPLIKMDERVKAKTPSFPSAAAGGLDFGDVDLVHFHHRVLTDAMAAGGAVAKRVFAAMMEMGKIDIAKIEAARRG